MTLPVIAVCNGGNSTPRSTYSTAPASSWTAGGNLPTFNNGSGGAWSAGAYSPTLNLFVAGNNSGDFSGNLTALAYSTDGTAWTAVTQANLDGGTTGWTVEDICWATALNLFVAVCSAGPTTTKRILTSPDGVVWTGRVLPDASKTMNGVCWSNDLSLLVAVGNSNAIYTSTDGITWTIASSLPGTSKNWYKVVWGGNGTGGGDQHFACIANNAGGSNDFCYSTAGTSWSQLSLAGGPGYSWVHIAYSPDLNYYAVVGGNTGVVVYGQAASSGASWTLKNSGIGSTPFQGICWSKDLSTFVGVGNTRDSLTSANGTTWALNSTVLAASQSFNKVIAGLTTTVTETGTANMTMPAFTQALAGISGAQGDVAMTMVLFSMDLAGSVLRADIGMVMPLFSMDAEGVVEQSVIDMVMPLFSMSASGVVEKADIGMVMQKFTQALAGMSGPYGIIDQTMPLFGQTAYGEQLANPGNPAFYSWWFLGP
jgi:hypothetical protein